MTGQSKKGYIPIGQTSDGKDFFSEAMPANIFKLEHEAAKDFWERLVSAEARSYFQLPDNHPIAKSNREALGSWVKAYNDDDNKPVQKILMAKIPWVPSQEVFFLAGRTNVLSCLWSEFLEYWDCFIAFSDECPLITFPGADQYLIFYPSGEFLRINTSASCT